MWLLAGLAVLPRGRGVRVVTPAPAMGAVGAAREPTILGVLFAPDVPHVRSLLGTLPVAVVSLAGHHTSRPLSSTYRAYGRSKPYKKII